MQQSQVSSLVSSFSRYIRDVAGDRAVAIVRRSDESANRLPIYLSLQYEPYEARLFDQTSVLLFSKGKDRPSPSEIENHGRIAGQHLSKPIVFVFENLASHQRTRLVERRVSFVVPGKQAYILPSLVDLRERVLSPATQTQSDALSTPGQMMVLLELILSLDETEDWPLSQWAERLGYSRMSISRASRELETLGLCTLQERGREIGLRFRGRGQSLWESALPHLTTPVKKISPVTNSDSSKLHFLEAGLTALSRFSDIAPPETRVLAGSESAFKLALEEGILRLEQFPDERTITVERWKYSPSTLSENQRTVDRFSLYLSLTTETNERILGALEELIQW